MLRDKLYSALVLAPQEIKQETYLEPDCSRFIVGGVLIQVGLDRARYLVGFYSKRLNAIEYNYPIYNKEILAIIQYLRFQQVELIGIYYFIILTNYNNLHYFIIYQLLNKRQSQQALELSAFQFTLKYYLGRLAT